LAATSKTNYTSTVRTKYLQKLLKTAGGYLVAHRFASKQKVERGAGDTIRVNKILRPARTTSTSAEGTLVTASSATNLVTNFREFSLENWGNSFGFNEDVEITSFVSDAQNREVIARQMAQSLERQLQKKLATQGMRWRIDKDTEYQRQGTATANSTTTSLESGNTFVITTDDLNGGYVTVINPDGPNYDITSAITDCTTTTADTAAVVFPQACTADSNFIATVGTGIAATDVLTTGALMDMSAHHELFETEKFTDSGGYRMFMHPAQHRDLWNDTTFVNSAIYDNSGRFKSYKVGRWFDIEFLIASELHRESESGSAGMTGAVYVSPVFGANAYSIYQFYNDGGSGAFGVKFYAVDTPDSGNLRNSAKYLSWKGHFAAGVTRATSCIGLMTGATSMGMNVVD
jgi:hypothetical protein